MKIEESKRLTTLSCVTFGDCVRVGNEACVLSAADGEKATCVGLGSGRIHKVAWSTEVEVLNAKVVIE